MRHVNAVTLAIAVVILSACKATTAGEDVPARISTPTQASRAELLRVVSGALNGSNVTIADEALTHDSLLVIEPTHSTGRDLGKPHLFRLVLSDSRCVLVQQETAVRLALTETACTAL